MDNYNDEKNSIANVTDLSGIDNHSKELVDDVKEIVDDAKEIIKEISNEEYREQLFGNDYEDADNMGEKTHIYNDDKHNVLPNVENYENKFDFNDESRVCKEENMIKENNENYKTKEFEMEDDIIKENTSEDMVEESIVGNQFEKNGNTENFGKNEKDDEISSKIENSDISNKNKSEKKKFSIHKLVILLVGLAILGVLGILLFKKLTAKKVIDYKALPVVDVTHVSKGSIGKDISLVGIIEPNNTYFIPAKVGGELKEIYVKNGDYVKKGDPICEIDASKEIEAAFIQYDTAKRTYERMQKLYRSGDISLQNFETVKAQYDGAKLTYDTKVEYATPVAVGDGYIENTNMTINTNVSTGNILCYITSDEGKEINFGVTERVLEGVEMGEKVVIEKNGKTYEGYVSNIAKLVNSKTGLFDVKAIITSENNFAAGIMAKATFEYDRRSNVNVLSNDIIYYENGNAFVYIVDKDNYVRRKYIDVGLENKDKCEIISGIDKNDKIVATWNNDLAEGVLVKIVNEEFPKDEMVKQSLTIKQQKKPVDETVVIDDPTIKQEIKVIGEAKIIGEEPLDGKKEVSNLPDKLKFDDNKKIENSFTDDNKVESNISSESKVVNLETFESTKYSETNAMNAAETKQIIETAASVEINAAEIIETVASSDTNFTNVLETTLYSETNTSIDESSNIIESSIVGDLKFNVETFERPTATISDNNKEIIESDDIDFIQKLKDKLNDLKEQEITVETTVSMEVKQ